MSWQDKVWWCLLINHVHPCIALFPKIWLFFSAPDGPPEKVHCVALTSNTIQVSWHPPKPHLRNGLIKGYKVLYVPRPDSRPSDNVLAPKTTRLSTVTTVLDHLEKFTNYSIQVLAFTQGGDGKYSRPISCITLTDGKLSLHWWPSIDSLKSWNHFWRISKWASFVDKTFQWNLAGKKSDNFVVKTPQKKSVNFGAQKFPSNDNIQKIKRKGDFVNKCYSCSSGRPKSHQSRGEITPIRGCFLVAASTGQRNCRSLSHLLKVRMKCKFISAQRERAPN